MNADANEAEVFDPAAIDASEVITGEGFSPEGDDYTVTDEERMRAMRSNLDGFDLEEDDLVIVNEDGEFLGFTEAPAEALPVVAIVGRPNVGKSALVNRILGRREAVVEDLPGVTRDRVSYPAEWTGKRFTLVDTGGWEPDAKGLDASVALQAEVAIELCDAVMFVVDSRVGADRDGRARSEDAAQHEQARLPRREQG